MNYKVIKDYPIILDKKIIGVTRTGTTLTFNNGYFVELKDGAYAIPKRVVENSPEWFEKVEQEFKVGDWVYVESHHHFEGRVFQVVPRKEPANFTLEPICLSTFEHTDRKDGYVIEKSSLRLATEEEIKKHLIAEAKKRGYEKVGVKIHSLEMDSIWALTKFDALQYDKGEDILRLQGDFIGNYSTYGTLPIYIKGKWAEIIKEEPIKIGGYTVEKDDSIDGIDCGGRKYSKTAIKNLSLEMSRFKLHTVITKDCNGKEIFVSASTINKILEMLK